MRGDRISANSRLHSCALKRSPVAESFTSSMVEVAGTPDVADEFQIVERFEFRSEGVFVTKDATGQVLVLHDLDVRQRYCAAHGVATVGHAVEEGLVAVEEGFGEAIAHDRGSQRRIA